MRIIFIIIFLLAIDGNASSVFACTIFTSSSPDVVFAANNEDMCTTNTLVHIFPESENKYGRILWGFKGDENFQGGMNEHGLFFDGAGTPPVEMSDWALPEFNKFIFETVLEKCKTVEEAITFVKKYSLPYLKFCHILVADANGDAVIFEWGNNRLNLLRKKDKNYLIATNFNITESENPSAKCNRYSTAQQLLENNEPSLDLFEKILSLTHNEGSFPTVYSNICDLKNKKVYLYNFHNYTYSKEIDLIEEINRGENQYMIRSFFPSNNAELWFRMKNDCINNFENLALKQVSIKVNSQKPLTDKNIYIKGSAKELGAWKDPGIKLVKINDYKFEETFPFKEGLLFDFTILTENNAHLLLDKHQKVINEKTVEVLSDTTITIDIFDWRPNK